MFIEHSIWQLFKCDFGRGKKVNSVVLWNSIFSNKAYLGEIFLDENEYLLGSFAVRKEQKAYECMGFSYSDNLVTSLKKFNLNHFQFKTAARVLIIADKEILKKNILNNMLSLISAQKELFKVVYQNKN